MQLNNLNITIFVNVTINGVCVVRFYDGDG